MINVENVHCDLIFLDYALRILAKLFKKYLLYSNLIDLLSISYMKKLRKKHDELAKIFLSDPVIAKEFLAKYLPDEILAKCNLSKINIQPESYIDEDLKSYYSDIVYKIDLYDQSDIDCIYLYSLIEHQSRPRKFMPLRIIRYQLEIIQKHLSKFRHSGVKLPLVVPIVLYNGKVSPYPYSCCISELFANQELYKNMPLGKFNLIDLTIKKDNEILHNGKLSLLEIITKHIHDRDFIKFTDLIIEALIMANNENINESLINCTFSYLIYAREKQEIIYLLEQVRQKLPDYEENVMSYAEELLQEGTIKGKIEGAREMQLNIAKELVKSGVDDTIVAKTTHLTLQQIQELKI